MIPLLLTTLMFLGPVDTKPAEKLFRIQCAILQGDPLGSKEDGNVEILAQPRLTLSNNKFGTFQFGSSDGNGECSVSVNLTPRYDAASGELFVRSQPTITMPDIGTIGIETTFVLRKPDDVRRIRLVAKSPTEQIWIEIKYVEVNEKEAVTPKK